MVMPRHSSGEAIELIAGAVVGRTAPQADKLSAWERLRGQGYRLAWVTDTAGVHAAAPRPTQRSASGVHVSPGCPTSPDGSSSAYISAASSGPTSPASA